MEISDLALRIILVLIPGFLTTLLFRYLGTHRDYSNFYFIVLSSVFGLSNYLVLEVLFQLLNLLKCIFIFITKRGLIIENKLFVSLWGSLIDRSFKVEPIEIIFASVIALISAIFYIWVYQKKIILRFANTRLHITNKSGDDDIWSHYLNSEEVTWVWIRDFNRSLTYFGRVKAFSDSGTQRELFMTDVSVYTISGKKELYNLNSAYISLSDGMYSIEQPKY
ncbi:hypothetical protein [Leptospira kirschneri]|uniref:Uncharacterized protein n=1 Tax=Leptospira kirschneri str. H1 TaxID=1049966 RepID=A0A0E2BBE2_9LEPT|nr:hypothetical protein [Leptospira kirschneri]EKO14447.1 hypothetical protein LEP1GSC081_2816 [Leptospira kirschneri str. H1]UML80665.1 hypothetical protein FH602_03005 [Leptospira kirschneri]